MYIEGRLETRKWTDKNGVERYNTDIIATDMKMLGSAKQSDHSESFKNNPSTAEDRAKARTGTGFEDMEDDIPY